jgi:uncharacterized protein YndB with AHSA1/START domain/ketosteroid isomerase-like protein
MTALAKTKPVAERELILTHIFDAPRALVFRMWIEPQHVAQWWGPRSFTNPVCEVDARPGGAILIHMRAPDGNTHPMGGEFHEIKPHERIVFTSCVDGPSGRILESHNTVTFEDQGKKTKLTLRAKAIGFADFAERMLAGMEPGWTESLEKLDEILGRTGAQTSGEDENEAQIRNVLADRTYALFGKNVDLAVKHLADDVVSFDLAPPLQLAGAAARDKKGIQAWFDTWQGPISWANHDLTVEIGGDIAFARSLGHMTGTKTDGYAVDLWVRCTVCFRRSGGVWKITHQHTSVPFYMDGSFKAAIDLKP